MRGFSPLNRLEDLEKLVLAHNKCIKKHEEEIMGLKERVAALESQIKGEVPYGQIYDTLWVMELKTSPPAPDESKEEWNNRFVEQYGSRDQFIAERMKSKEV